MVTYRAENFDSWVRASEKRMDAVAKQSVNDLMVLASRTSEGTSRGGSVRQGYIPRADGFLASSLVSSLNGSTAIEGEASWRFVVPQMEAGDVALFGWTASYARVQHYKGWLWVDSSAKQWSRIVRDAVARAKIRSGS